MARNAIALTIVLMIAFALVPASSVGDALPAAAADYVVAFRHAPNANWAVAHGLGDAHGIGGVRSLHNIHALLVHAPPALVQRAIALDPDVAYVERNLPLHFDSSSWTGTGWDGTGWDGTGWDGTGWDGTGWDGTGWDGTGWDGTGWDGTGWDGTGWDGTGWDGTGWDGTGWDGTGWDGTGWDASAPDTLYGLQWGLGAIHAPEAWANYTHGLRNVTVCVLDTGIDASHPDLVANLYTAADGSHGYNAMTGTTNVTDDVGHGTYVSGVLAGVGGNSMGVLGVAQEKILAVKVMGATGGTEADLAAGIGACVDRGARVLSLSLHTTEPSQLLSDAIDAALAAGAVVVAAAGNEGAASVNYPASHPGVIAVGAATLDAHLASFSNHGSRLDLVAPGVDIVSTRPGGYARANGTSAAVPFVSGTAALMFDLNASLTGSQVASLLKAHARDLGASGFDTTFGYGALDTHAALMAASG